MDMRVDGYGRRWMVFLRFLQSFARFIYFRPNPTSLGLVFLQVAANECKFPTLLLVRFLRVLLDC